MFDLLQQLDEKMFLAINGFNSPFFDGLMWWISLKTSWIPLYVLLLGWLIYKYRLKSLILIPAIILVIIVSDQGSVHLFKNVFERLRPSHNPELQDIVHLVNNYRGGQFGFISSHAANSFALVSFLIPFFNKRWFTILMITWAVVIAYSRIYLGVHYPFDVIAGGAFGWIVGYGFVEIVKVLSDKYKLKIFD